MPELFEAEEMREALTVVTDGCYLGFTISGQFSYGYTCSVCEKKFRDAADRVTGVVLCHLCVIGDRRGAAYCQPSGRRKSRHKPKE